MRRMTARELKARTGEALKTVAAGDQVLITRHGKPLAVLVPYGSQVVQLEDVRPFDVARPEIEQSLRQIRSPFPSWRAALDASRRRK